MIIFLIYLVIFPWYLINQRSLSIRFIIISLIIHNSRVKFSLLLVSRFLFILFYPFLFFFYFFCYYFLIFLIFSFLFFSYFFFYFFPFFLTLVLSLIKIFLFLFFLKFSFSNVKKISP